MPIECSLPLWVLLCIIYMKGKQQSGRLFGDYSDQELVDLLMKDRGGAIDEMYFRYYRMLYTSANIRTRSKMDAEECVHEVFFNLTKRATRIRLSTTLLAYLIGAVGNKVTDLMHEKSRKGTVALDSALHLADTNIAEPDELCYMKMQEERYAREINRLPHKYREVLVLKMEGNNYKKIAEQLDIGLKAVEKRIKQARDMVRNAIGK